MPWLGGFCAHEISIVDERDMMVGDSPFRSSWLEPDGSSMESGKFGSQDNISLQRLWRSEKPAFARPFSSKEGNSPKRGMPG
jgi:hypothetical protein